MSSDLFRYTSGRWLWDEEQQLRDRFSPFNVSELQNVAARSVGADHCTGIIKLAEGSYNKTFRLTMNNGATAIARIPHPIAGPRYYMTASEVATMDFARTILQIPVPRVFAWSADDSDPVASEYIIMEEAPGTKLDDVWEGLSLEEKAAVMKDLVVLQKKMASVSFNRYGNLYYADDGVEKAVPVEISGDLPIEVKRSVTHRFVIGPVAERAYWHKERSAMNVDRGPWQHPADFATSVGRRELDWIRKYAVPKPADDPLVTSASQNSPSRHISLLERYLKVAPYLFPSDPDVVAPHLWHNDLHSANIFVQNGRISSVIDWQETWAAPFLFLGRHPRLVAYSGDIILQPPADFNELPPEEKRAIRARMSKSIILYLYEKKIAKEVPLLDKVIRYPHGRTRCDAINFAGDTWEDDILPLRESLIRMERYWGEMGLEGPCPIHFTEDELRLHAEEGDGWNEVQDFWESVSFIVSRDGWTPNDRYGDALTLFTELRETGLKSMVGKEREDFERQTNWVDEQKDR
ncbi:aminoglycoside phosphotransferase family protein [Aspergillus mulundensis]|uniref:Phosphotransferase family protein n=1 Tax=Aspergillus mulundensis TaxID=1810919 RepID=A0A3D8QHE2_9EURO|nr:Phosphotransferase family protein [Aspergillus mulundensis]RDW61118.1 Phosphotransferase family protein [Aspergillus mulundensis]